MKWMTLLKTTLAASIGLALLMRLGGCAEGRDDHHDDWDHHDDSVHHDDHQDNHQDDHHQDGPENH